MARNHLASMSSVVTTKSYSYGERSQACGSRKLAVSPVLPMFQRSLSLFPVISFDFFSTLSKENKGQKIPCTSGYFPLSFTHLHSSPKLSLHFFQ